MDQLLSVRPWPAAAGVAALHLLFALFAFEPAPHTGGDNAAYIALGRSLLETGEYRSIYDPARPPQTQYPPVFPAILAAAMLVGLMPWVGLKLVTLLFSTAAVGLSYLWIRERAPPRLALAAGLLLAVSPGIIAQSHWILSDVPFWAFTMLALWALETLKPGDWRRFAVAVTAILLAYFTRSAGLPLVVAALGWFMLRRRWKEAAILAGVVLPLAALWWLRAQGLGGVDYLNQFLAVDPYRPAAGRLGAGDLLRRMLANDGRYLTHHLPTLMIGATGLLAAIISAIFIALSVLGWVGRMRRPGVAELFLLLYVGLLFVWPEVWSGERFLLPVYPVMLALAAEAVRDLAAYLGERAPLVVGGLATAALMLISVPALYRTGQFSAVCGRRYLAGETYACVHPRVLDFLQTAEWARGALPEDAVVISRKPRLFWAVSGRPGRVFPMSRDPDELLAMAREIGARYLVLDHIDALSAYYLAPILVQRPDAFCGLRYLGPERVSVFGIADDAAAVEDRDSPASGQDADTAIAMHVCPASYYAEEAR